MIDELKTKCFVCNAEGLLTVYDPERNVYFCPECCKMLNHEPPYSNEELIVLMKSIIKETRLHSKRQLFGYP